MVLGVVHTDVAEEVSTRGSEQVDLGLHLARTPAHTVRDLPFKGPPPRVCGFFDASLATGRR